MGLLDDAVLSKVEPTTTGSWNIDDLNAVLEQLINAPKPKNFNGMIICSPRMYKIFRQRRKNKAMIKRLRSLWTHP